MSRATEAFHNRVAVIFDFDKTLAPDSVDALLSHCGFDPERFREERVEPLKKDGWDATLAQFFRLIEASHSDEGPTITRRLVQEVGKKMDPYEGVPEMFEQVRKSVKAIGEEVEVEFYLLTCGFLQIPSSMAIAKNFEAIWGSEFHYDSNGEIAFAKQVITFPEKVRYILAMAKGLSPEGANEPADVYRQVPDEEWHVPLDQVVYVGDGGSDMPAFQLLNDRGGIAIGLFKGSSPDEWSGYDSMHARRRVQNLARADYRAGSELMRSLTLAVESLSKLIELRRLGIGE